MRNWANLTALVLFTALLGACAGHNPRLPPPSTDIDETVYRNHLRMLSSDEFEGRRPGSSGEDKTVAYLTEQFRKLGLKPGNGDSFLQTVPLVEIALATVPTLILSGRAAVPDLTYGKDMVIWSRQGSPQVQLQKSELIFVGYGIVAPEFAWNDYANLDVHGKTVVVLINDPGYGTHDPRLFKGGAMSYYGRWDYKIEEAERQGAAGVLLVHDRAAAGYGWNVVQSTWSGPQLELASAPAAQLALAGWISQAAAQSLFTAAGLDFTAAAASAAHSGFKASALGLRADATLHNDVRRFNSSNVVAQLPGHSQQKEYVIYSAHWDSLGQDASLGAHGIYNGAVDNASGVAGLLAMALSFTRTKPPVDRTLVFLALTAAEPSLLGSQFYVENPLFSLRDTAAVLDLDSLRERGPSRNLTIYGFGNSDLEESARSVALLQGREVTADPTPEWGMYFRSDDFSFANAGVPALYVSAGLDDSARGPQWGRAQLDDYVTRRYRQPADQYSAAWDVRGALEDLNLYYEVGNRVARSRRFPRWYPNSEFRVGRAHGAAPH